jgi:hypothetical protein
LPEGKDPTEASEDELKSAFNKLIRIKKKEVHTIGWVLTND